MFPNSSIEMHPSPLLSNRLDSCFVKNMNPPDKIFTLFFSLLFSLSEMQVSSSYVKPNPLYEALSSFPLLPELDLFIFPLFPIVLLLCILSLY